MIGAHEPPATDTPEGCRTRATQDRARAERMDTDNGRLRLERSAAAWDSRADALEALASTCDIRRAAARAEWDEAERYEGGDNAEGSDR